MTPIAYSVPGFGKEAFGDSGRVLEDLAELGFRWVTLTPTYLAIDSVPLQVDFARSPQFERIEQAVRRAHELGMRVRLEPHLDWESTLTGGPYEWRRRMQFDPTDWYARDLILPLSELGPDELTLGSELDAAWLAQGALWAQLAREVRRKGAATGHKLNHDALVAHEELHKLIHTERARVQLATWSRRESVEARLDANVYLRGLDYVSFSFYPPGSGEDNFERRFHRALKEVDASLRAAAGFGPELVIGEFGLGSADAGKPWEFKKETMLDEQCSLKADVVEVRRAFYLGFLTFLRTSTRVGSRAACFWTVDQYDFLGVLPFKQAKVFRDEVLRQAVKRYNAHLA
jgi:hypothetical protein